MPLSHFVQKGCIIFIFHSSSYRTSIHPSIRNLHSQGKHSCSSSLHALIFYPINFIVFVCNTIFIINIIKEKKKKGKGKPTFEIISNFVMCMCVYVCGCVYTSPTLYSSPLFICPNLCQRPGRRSGQGPRGSRRGPVWSNWVENEEKRGNEGRLGGFPYQKLCGNRIYREHVIQVFSKDGFLLDPNSISFGFVIMDQKTSSSHSKSSGLISGNGLSRLALAAFGSFSDIFEGVSVAG